MKKLPTGTISGMTTLMSEGDLQLLQWLIQDSYEELPPEQVEWAYNVARKMHPSAPSLKELMAWDRQAPARDEPGNQDSGRMEE